MNDAKATLRDALWTALEDAGDARFPGTRGRIPNFRGAEAAAAHLLTHPALRGARRVKANPDSPQRPVRAGLLRAGVTVVLAVPKLASDRPFLLLDPARLGPERLWHASSIRGATALGVPATPEEVGAIDAVITGCVGVGADGARLGKGGGYADLEYALLRELGLVDDDTPILTTIHPCQAVAAGAIPMDAHDTSVDAYATPDGLVHLDRAFPRPGGVDPAILPAEKREAIPVLRDR